MLQLFYDSEYVIANVMDDVENVNAREYLIDFHAKSIYPAIEAMVLKEQNLDTICKDVIKGFKAGICPHSKVHITLDESKE